MLDYQSMKVELLRFKKPSIGQLVETVLEFSIATQVCAAIAKAHPGDYRKRLKSLAKTALSNPVIRGRDGEYPLSATITTLINEHLFPVDEIWLWDEMMNLGEDPVVHLSIQGPRLSYDDFADIMSSAPHELPDDLGFPMMVALIWGWYDGDVDIQTVWKVYNERFHWGIPDWPDLPDERYLDFKVFRRQLKKARDPAFVHNPPGDRRGYGQHLLRFQLRVSLPARNRYAYVGGTSQSLEEGRASDPGLRRGFRSST